ncbi:hypothetical protein ES703_30964 [subsurface metagenome]
MLKGMIIVWYGAIVDIPDGWALCDGSNGTPDLRNRSIVGPGGRYAVDEAGGARWQSHTFTGDGHKHDIEGIHGPAALGVDGPEWTDSKNVTGTTDTAEIYHPFRALCHIMKLHDDPDPREDLPWPYAAKAIIQHTHQANILKIWITFRFSMNTDNKPADNLWLVEIDGIPEAIDSSAWVDPWTMLLTIDPLIGAPEEVTIEYNGPDELLATRWDKQWEPWGPIPSVEIPTPPETKIFSTGPAPQDDVDVSGITVLFIDCSANDVIIGGFVGGVNGQVLQVAKLCIAAQDVTLEHEEGGGNQDLHLHAGGDETLRGEYGGWTLACNGTDWYDISHAKHV